MESIVLKRAKGKRVALQFPEGMRHRAFGFAKTLEREHGCEVVLLGDACYGACDLPGVSMLAEIGADLLVHLGHLPFPGEEKKIGRTKVIFLEMRMDIDLKRMSRVVLKNVALKKLGPRVGLATTAQHIHQIEGIAEMFEKRGVRAELVRWGSRSLRPGHLIGCSFSAAVAFKGTSILYVGTGEFHPLGLALASPVPVFQYDPEKGEVIEHTKTKDRFLRRRFASIANAQGARRFGILVSSKPGQFRRELASRVREMLADAGREASIIVVDEVRPDLLNYMDVDAWVNTACPRIALDDSERFEKPVLTFYETEILLGKRGWEKYKLDSFG